MYQSCTWCTRLRSLSEDLHKKMRAIACMKKRKLASMDIALSSTCMPSACNFVSLYHVWTFRKECCY